MDIKRLFGIIAASCAALAAMNVYGDEPRFLAEYCKYNMNMMRGNVESVAEKQFSVADVDADGPKPVNEHDYYRLTKYREDRRVSQQTYSYRHYTGEFTARYIYDPRKRSDTVNVFYRRDTPDEVYIYNHDEFGRLVKVSDYSEGELCEAYGLEYGDGGLERITYFDGDGKVVGSRAVSTGFGGERAELEEYYDGRVNSQGERYDYNQHGDVAESRTLDENGEVSITTYWEYVYDDYGNWTQRAMLTQWPDDEYPTYVNMTIREIIYR